MCNVSDYIWEKAATDTIRKIVMNMFQRGDGLDSISEVTGCPLEEVKKIVASL